MFDRIFRAFIGVTFLALIAGVFFSTWGGLGVAAADSEKNTVLYNSIPDQLPGNVASIDVWGRLDLGDGLDLAHPGGKIGQVTVILSSWACQTGTWGAGCTTTPGATYSWPITVNIYGVTYPSASPSYDTPTPNGLLGTITENLNIPYRPSSKPSKCSGGPQWYDA